MLGIYRNSPAFNNFLIFCPPPLLVVSGAPAAHKAILKVNSALTAPSLQITKPLQSFNELAKKLVSLNVAISTPASAESTSFLDTISSENDLVIDLANDFPE